MHRPPGILHKFCTQNGIDDPEVRKLCRVDDVVYEVECALCAQNNVQSWYCGQSVRPVGDRFEEHIKAAKRCAECPVDDARNTTKQYKANALGAHFFECHRGQEPALRCKMLYKTFGSLDRDCMEGTAVRRIPRFNINRRLEDNGIKFD